MLLAKVIVPLGLTTVPGFGFTVNAVIPYVELTVTNVASTLALGSVIVPVASTLFVLGSITKRSTLLLIVTLNPLVGELY